VILKHLATPLSLILLAGCNPATESARAPEAASDSAVVPSTVTPAVEPFDGVAASDVVRSVVDVSPTVLSAGDTAFLRVATTNAGGDAISARSGCAPGLGFRIRRPDGSVIDPYEGLAFICPRLDSQDLLAGETDTVSWAWAGSELRGRYEVIGGLLVDGMVVGPSAPVTFEVR
jgi:hypothetical protein